MNTVKEKLIRRAELEECIRHFFKQRNYLEVRTPLLVASPGMEPHIKPVVVQGSVPVFLPTSPEFGMKKLLATGLEKIFQLAPSFRNEPLSPQHRPEFLMLEWYAAGLSLESLQVEVEDFIIHVAGSFLKFPVMQYGGFDVSLRKSWPRYRVNDLFIQHLGLDLRLAQDSAALAAVCKSEGISASASEPWNDLYFKLWLDCVEPKLPSDSPCFVTHYPVSQSSLCKRVRDEQGFEWANRFEVYVGRMEIANAFDELTDPDLQLKNFQRDQEERRRAYGSGDDSSSWPESPIDHELIAALRNGFPSACSGIALGVDRLAMLIFNASNIDDVAWMKPAALE